MARVRYARQGTAGRRHFGRRQAGTLTLQVLDDAVELPVPCHGCPWDSAMTEAVISARLALIWHSQTPCPGKRVCPASSIPELPAVKVREAGLRHTLSLPMCPHYME